MVTRLFEGMRRVDLMGKVKGPSENVSQEQFTVSMSHLLKGNSEEKSLVIMKMISATEGPVKAREVQKVTGHNRNMINDGEKLLGPEQLAHDCDRAVIEDWVFRTPHVAMFLSVVIHRGFLLHLSLDLATLIPERQVDLGREFASILDVLSVVYINSHLPGEWRHRWRLLFASELHGHSFAQLCGLITHRGPCVMLLEDRDSHVFGGFASCSWEVKPQFQGDDRCFLFSIFPRMAVYTCTGYNDHYMYLNHGQQTIPNGLVRMGQHEGRCGLRMSDALQGMGGQHSYFGLWIDFDFGKGHSKAKPTCTTYNSPQLSAQEDFRFERMEVWAVGDASVTQPAKSSKSILDVDLEAQSLLEISGRSRHSEGLREVPEEDQ
ncbi:TLD domain-containing protein [Camelus ferus]|nr:TLD domain-containing protein [Camelus ferus]